MLWTFPILSRFIPGLAPRSEVEPDQGPPRPAYPPPIHPNDPGYDYELNGTYSNKIGTAYNLVYWPDFDAWSYHFAEGAAQGHSSKRKWYGSKDEMIDEIEAMR